MPVLPISPVTQAIADRLTLVTGATGYLGEVGRTLDGRLNVDPPTKTPTDARVQPYFTLYPSPGAPGIQPNLCLTDPDLDWSGQITAVAGDVSDLDWLVDRLRAVLDGWRPAVPGLQVGSVRGPRGYDPGPYRADRTVTPTRLYVPLLFVTTVTA